MGRVYLDTEFLEDGRTIDLISIGMVTEDGREYYAVNADMPVRRIRRHQWLMDNVVPRLPKGSGDMRNTWSPRWLFHPGDPTVKRRETIAREVRAFILAAGPGVDLWADYAAYDHVVLAQLFGPMIDLPDGIPMYTNDLQQEAARLVQDRIWAWDGNPPVQESGRHNALQDARYARELGRYLQALAAKPHPDISDCEGHPLEDCARAGELVYCTGECESPGD